MLESHAASRQKRRGPWCKKLAKALRSGVLPNSRKPLPTDVMRIIVDMLIREDRALAHVLGRVSKSFRIWVLQILYDVVIFTSPAHVGQMRIVSTLAGSLTTHVHHVSLAGLEMHIYGELDREGGLYMDLQRLLSACENLETILYDFKRVSLPFTRDEAPRSLTQAHWTHPSRDDWRGYEPAMEHITHLRVDCAQNDTKNARVFDTLLSLGSFPPFPNLTHFSFGVDARLSAGGTQRTVDFVRNMLLHRPQLVRIVIMMWHYNPQRSVAMRDMLAAYDRLKNPRVCLFLSHGAPDEVSSVKDWENVARGGATVWNQADSLFLRLRNRGMKVATGHELILGSIVYLTTRPLHHVDGYLAVA